jgi:hypothetical protein
VPSPLIGEGPTSKKGGLRSSEMQAVLGGGQKQFFGLLLRLSSSPEQMHEARLSCLLEITATLSLHSHA